MSLLRISLLHLHPQCLFSLCVFFIKILYQIRSHNTFSPVSWAFSGPTPSVVLRDYFQGCSASFTGSQIKEFQNRLRRKVKDNFIGV